MLADAYAAGAAEAGYEIKRINVGALRFPVLRSQAEFQTGAVPADIADAQSATRWSEHLVLVYPLWMGTMPALLQAFFEQTLRPGFGFDEGTRRLPIRRLKGRSARIIVTMGMPALAYRWYFGAHGLRNLKRSVPGLCGIGPIKDTLIGMIEGIGEGRYARLLERMRGLGRRAV